MRAVQVTELAGPDALRVADVPEPEPSHPLTPGEGVLVDVEAAAVSFPDTLQARGLYQHRAEPPYVPGAEVAGTVRSAPEGSGFAPGDRVAACTMLGALAEVAVAPAFLTFTLPDRLDAAQGAALVMNYHTAYFGLKLRGRLREGERVLVHGAAGGVGTAALQVARGLGARTVAVVSDDEKERVARSAGADEVLRSGGPWREQAVESGGVDVVFDPVGGDRFVDSIRSLREDGRVLVVGFAAGGIPEVRVNRVLLRNVDIVGVNWGGYVMTKPELNREIGAALDRMIADGVVDPIVGARFPLERAADAFRLIEGRGAIGKVVVEL